jgi:hypothetical protein
MNPLFILFLIILSSNAWAQDAGAKKSITELSSLADYSCLNVRVIGICPKPSRNPPIGLKLKFWQPEVFMETVKMPGDYVISEYGATLSSVDKKISQGELGLTGQSKSLKVTSGNSSHSLSGHQTQFNEVHLYDFPAEAGFDALCSDEPNLTLGIRYLSEGDSIAWRKEEIEKYLPQSIVAPRIGPQCKNLPIGAEGQCMRSWGPLYPRTGFVIAANEAVSSIVDSIRSISIASNPAPLHVVEAILNFQPNLPIDKVQMIYPQRTQCFPIGQDPRLWETQSKDGHYVWIFWHQRQCCA